MRACVVFECACDLPPLSTETIGSKTFCRQTSEAYRLPACARAAERVSDGVRVCTSGGLGARLVVLDNLVLSPREDDKFNDSLQKLTGGATRGTENDDFQTDGKREASAEDGDADIAITEGGEESDGDWF